MRTIEDFKKLGYRFENPDNINRVIRVRNNDGRHIYTIFIESGFKCLTVGSIFNYINELNESINAVGIRVFFKDILN